MGSGFDYSVSSLLCSETHTVCFDDLDCNAIDEFFPSWNFQNPIFRNGRSESWIEFPMLSEERLREMVEREREYLPRDDYLERLRSGDLDMGVRREAVDWILKVCSLILSNGFLRFSQDRFPILFSCFCNSRRKRNENPNYCSAVSSHFDQKFYLLQHPYFISWNLSGYC